MTVTDPRASRSLPNTTMAQVCKLERPQRSGRWRSRAASMPFTYHEIFGLYWQKWHQHIGKDIERLLIQLHMSDHNLKSIGLTAVGAVSYTHLTLPTKRIV